ncbi:MULTISPECIES: LuxR C-terminal-related transcriptional regulator [unclassified Streptomyces]|uniref:LuxR C-terminal-related transcriptional regulator n=1 Tax=unclassified Streptomyces TaxID=2593676 RepID=UPI0036AD60CD
MRVVLAEDLFLLRDGISNLLSAHGCEIVASVGSGPELEDALRQHVPDIVVVDVRLPPSYTDEGLRIALSARRANRGLPVLVLSQHVEQLYARELLSDAAGGVGYLLKDRVLNETQFIEAVRRVAAGGTALDPEVISKLLTSNAGTTSLSTLTAREAEVLGLMAEGRSNAAIAARLFVSEGAVSKHTTRVFNKLGLAPSDDDNRRVLAVLAYLNRDRDREV